MTFKPDTTFNSSHRMDVVAINRNYALGKFGEGNGASDDGKCEFSWSGSFTAADGTVMRASFWDFKGSLNAGYVSVWVDNAKYLQEFKDWIKV